MKLPDPYRPNPNDRTIQINTDYGVIPCVPPVENELIDLDRIYKVMNDLWNVGLETAEIIETKITPESPDDKERVHLLMKFHGTYFIEVTDLWEKMHGDK